MLDLLCEIVNKLATEQLTKYVDASGDDDDGDYFGGDDDNFGGDDYDDVVGDASV